MSICYWVDRFLRLTYTEEASWRGWGQAIAPESKLMMSKVKSRRTDANVSTFCRLFLL